MHQAGQAGLADFRNRRFPQLLILRLFVYLVAVRNCR